MPTDDELISALYGQQTSEQPPQPVTQEDAIIAELYGDKPKAQPSLDRGNIADSMLQGLTMGWGDEGLSYGLAAIGKLTGDVPESISFDEARAGFLDELRGRQQEFAERNPKTALGGEVIGGMLTGGAGLAKAGGALLKPSSSLLRKGGGLCRHRCD